MPSSGRIANISIVATNEGARVSPVVAALSARAVARWPVAAAAASNVAKFPPMKSLVLISQLVFLISFMFTLGLRLRPDLVKSELAHPGHLGRGLVLALVLVPIATAIVVRALGLTGIVAAAIVLVSVCPTAPLMPLAAKTAKGNPSTAMMLVIALGILTAFLAAPSARFLLAYKGELDLRPPSLVAKLLLLQVLPIAAGATLHRFAPELSKKLGRVLMPVVLISGLVLIVGAMGPMLPKLGILGWRGLVAILASMAVAVLLGWLMGGHDATLSRTFAATSSVPNVGLAIALVRAAHGPQLAMAMVAAVFVVRALTNLLWVQVLGRLHPGAAERPVVPVQAKQL